MVGAHEDSTLHSLRELRAIADARTTEQREAKLRAEQKRQHAKREAAHRARERAHAASLAAEARQRSERVARERREQRQQLLTEMMSRFAAVQEQLEHERRSLDLEMQIKAAHAAKTKPALLLAIVAMLLLGVGLLGSGLREQHRAQRAQASQHVAQLAQLRAKAERAQRHLDDASLALDETRERRLAEQAEANARAAREAAEQAKAEQLAKAEQRRQQEQLRRERARIERERKAEWERLHGRIDIDSDCANDPLCGVGL